MYMLSGNQKGLIFILSLILIHNSGFTQKNPTPKFNLIHKINILTLGESVDDKTKDCLSIPKNYQIKQLGFMCRKEWQVEKKTGLPFRFRLGSSSYCDWLEGKPNAIRNIP